MKSLRPIRTTLIFLSLLYSSLNSYAGSQISIPVLHSPGGTPIGYLNDFSNLETIEKNNEWSKVIIKGWIRSPLMPEDQTPKPKGFIPSIMSLDEIPRHPESQNAPVVLWDVIFVKMNKARMNTFAPDGTEYMWCWGPGGQTNNLTVLFNKKEDREIFRKIKKFEKSTLYLRLKSPNGGFSKGPVFEYVGRLKSKSAFQMETFHVSDLETPMSSTIIEEKALPEREGLFPMPMVVTAQSTLVRTGPGKDYRYLIGKKKGDIVVVTQQKGEWNKIQLSETTTGFIHSRLLKPFAPQSPIK